MHRPFESTRRPPAPHSPRTSASRLVPEPFKSTSAHRLSSLPASPATPTESASPSLPRPFEYPDLYTPDPNPRPTYAGDASWRKEPVALGKVGTSQYLSITLFHSATSRVVMCTRTQ